MPKRIEKYQLGKTLGRGTFSRVKYAVDTTTNRPYAIKVIDRKMIKKENMESQLKREIAIMKILKHPHIVELKEVLQSSKHIYIVLELVTGGELFDRIVQAKRFSEKTARRYFQQLISGVYYSHSQGIAHRDLKPENLLLDENDNLKISDFGLSALSSGSDGRHKLLTTTCGTPNYVAPEVLKEKGYSGFRADIWSCGIILYVMLAGYLPFEDETMSGLFNKIENGVYSFPAHFSLEIRKLISRILTVNPSKRLSLEQIMNHKWFKVDWDPQQLKKMMSKSKQISVSKEMIRNSIGETSGVTQKDDENEKKKDKRNSAINAFEIASLLTKGSMNSLMNNAVNIHRETKFFVNGKVPETQKEILKVLKKMKCNPSVKSKSNDIKCFLNYHNSILTFIVALQEAMGGLCFVEVRRRKGEILHFNEMYRKIVEELGDLVVKKKEE